MKKLVMPLNSIQPSQLYISRAKLLRVNSYLDKTAVEDIDPLPIKKIGDIVFFTDGHTRAFALAQRGIKEVPVYWDADELDWLLYLKCVNWCREAGITNISDLSNRVVGESEYQRLWIDRCEALGKGVAGE